MKIARAYVNFTKACAFLWSYGPYHPRHRNGSDVSVTPYAMKAVISRSGRFMVFCEMHKRKRL